MADWIQGAIKHPGSLHRAAAKAGAVDKKTGKIKASWLAKQAKGNGTTARRARLAQTLSKLRS